MSRTTLPPLSRGGDDGLHDRQPIVRRPGRELGDAAFLRIGPGMAEQGDGDELVVDDEIGLGEQFDGAEGEEPRMAGPGARPARPEATKTSSRRHFSDPSSYSPGFTRVPHRLAWVVTHRRSSSPLLWPGLRPCHVRRPQVSVFGRRQETLRSGPVQQRSETAQHALAVRRPVPYHRLKRGPLPCIPSCAPYSPSARPPTTPARSIPGSSSTVRGGARTSSIRSPCDFDAKGRLLVVESHTHFRPAKYNGPKFDRIRMLEDTDGDGKADKFTTFFEGTTHTMDLAVHPDGSVYVATRNEILRLRDTEGDGKADEKTRIAFLDTEGQLPAQRPVRAVRSTPTATCTSASARTSARRTS